MLAWLSSAGYAAQAKRFLCALESEREHLQCVRMWLAGAQGRSVDSMESLSQEETR